MRLVKSSFRFVLFILLVCFIGNADAAKRTTETLVLKNGLSVLLEHDPDVHRSAVALAVGTGILYDSPDKMGLAHYLEHMLFLGTKRFPEVDSFKKFLHENSGASNAYTADAITNYFLQVSHEGFDEALDRFSDFFVAPLFDKKYAERELNAVSSEHDKNKLDDGWRINYVEDLMSEPGHPTRNFGTGNKDTLAKVDQKALQAFHKKYYSAKNMKLAVLSNKPLKEQAQLVRKYFEAIPSFAVQLPKIDPQFRKPLKDKYRLLKIKTIKDIRQIQLSFPTIRLADYHDSKPAGMIAYIIGHEGEGSLLSQLKKEGLALGLSAGASAGQPDINIFNISIALTAEGMARYERVLDLVFSYIQLLREEGIKEETFKENQAMAQIDFDWKDPDEGMGHVSGKAALMFNFDIKDVETLPYLFKKYDPASYKAVLDTLTPENMMATLQNNAVETDKKAPFYGTEYALKEIGGKSFDNLRHPSKIEGLKYPKKNDFIPYNLSLERETPHLIRNDESAKIWFKYDNRFKQPKVFMKLRIETAMNYDTLEHAVLSMLYDAAVDEALNEQVYPIQMAGLSYNLSSTKEGMVLSVGGYSERISDLVRLVALNLTNPKIDTQKFNNLKEAILLGLENKKKNQAYVRSGYFSSLLWLKRQFDDDDFIKALKPLTLEDLRKYEKQLYEKSFITGVVYGNWTDEKINESVHILLDELKSHSLPESERFKQSVNVLPDGESILFSPKVEDENNAILYTLQAGPRDLNRAAKILLVSSIMESDFFTEMRTNQQLGYIVHAHPERIEDRLFYKFIIQSATYSPFELNKRIDAWLTGTKKLLSDLTDDEFEKHRAGLIVSLEKEPDSIADMTNDLYYFATDEKGDFQRKIRLVKEVGRLTKDDVIAFANDLFLNPKISRSIILIRSKSNVDVPADGVMTEISQIKSRLAKR